ncbi:MAG TPA: adenine phosphoribosyltransferase [Candidatus Binatia bacterium]|nr:adenine phosphoribosyltransferase [Candidatus Binatia bacterium]
MADQRRAHPPASRAAATGAASSPEGRAEAVLPTAGAIVTATGDLDAALSERLRGLVRNIPDFPRPGVLFRDITTLLSDAQAFRATIEALAEPYRDRDVEVVVGIESRGFVLGGAIALTLGAGFVPVRKQGKLPYRTISVAYTLEYGEAVLEVHADAIAAGRRVLIVDDLLATGGTARATAELVERLGGQVVGLAFLIELSELGGSAALGDRPHTSLIRY